MFSPRGLFWSVFSFKGSIRSKERLVAFIHHDENSVLCFSSILLEASFELDRESLRYYIPIANMTNDAPWIGTRPFRVMEKEEEVENKKKIVRRSSQKEFPKYIPRRSQEGCGSFPRTAKGELR